MANKTTPPKWFWIVSILALIWNLMGVMAFAAQMAMSPEAIAALPEAERELFTNIPAWVNIAFGTAVISGALGCISLLIRKSWAHALFVISICGVAVQMFHSFFMSNSYEVYGPGGTIMPVMIVVILIALIFLAKNSKSKNWLN